MPDSSPLYHEVASVDALPEEDPLGLLHRVGRVLALHGEANPILSQGNALRVVAEHFDASLTAMVRFEESGAHFIGIWAAGRYESDPQIRVTNELLPPGSPMRSQREALAFEPEAFGPIFGALLRDIGDGAPLLVAPVVDGGDVLGSILVLSPAVSTMSEHDLIAAQLCGELLWRYIRNHEVRTELAQRAEVAEILAAMGGRLQEGGIGEARQLLDEVFEMIGPYVGAVEIITYEVESDVLVPVAVWPEQPDNTASVFLEEHDLEVSDATVVFHQHQHDALAQLAAPDAVSGVLVPGINNGKTVGLFAVTSEHVDGFSAPQIDLIAGAVRLLGQFRLRIGSELEIIRRGVVDQARSEIAEAFVNAGPDEIDGAVDAALQKIGGVFGARRVRWAEVDVAAKTGDVVAEWDDGTRPARPTEFSVKDAAGFDTGARVEPFVLGSKHIEEASALTSTAPTLLVPGAPGRDRLSILTLTGDGVDRLLPDGERRTLMDLADLLEQARSRAQHERESDYREMLDDLKLRLARRFLDRSTTDPREVIDWALAEVGEALGGELLAFSESVSAEDSKVHWWLAQDSDVAEAAPLAAIHDAFENKLAGILGSGEPLYVRSRLLPDGERQRAERISGGREFSVLCVPLRAPGVALLLGVAVLRDRVWLPIETALLQQTIGQIRQFIDVVTTRGKLNHDANHDSLTGLPNRRSLTEDLQRLLDAERTIAVLMIDVDRFKVINDSLGHSAGDLVLVTVAERIREALRGDDLVGRFGGDEFAVVLVDADGDLEMAATAQRLIEAIRQPIDVRGFSVIPTCSVGIAAAAAGDGVDRVVRHADAALYDAKAKGRNCYEFFDDAHRQTLRDRLHLETRLRSGVAAGEFVPWFQPEYDLASNEVVGFEALVRWDHPEAGLLEAHRFIDSAEEMGLAPELSRLVLDGSLQALREWNDNGLATRMRVNVAAAQLQTKGLAEEIGDALDTYGLAAESLCVEITERSLMLDLDSAVDALRAVRDLGVEVAIDDFGTGFSSLARLKDLPVDTLKIDRSFVAGIVHSTTDREIVRTIIWLTRALGLDVVAEGVEEDEQAALLLDMGCHRAQGWLWSPAVPSSALPNLARHRASGLPPS